MAEYRRRKTKGDLFVKKILYNLQLSAVERFTGKFLLEKDSNYSVFINAVKAFNLEFEDVEHYCIIPKVNQVAGDKYYTGVKHINYVRARKTPRVFSSRYHWDADEMAKIIEQIRPNVIWENNPTLVNNWKTLLLELGFINSIKVVTYNHWVDSNKYPKIDRRCLYTIRQAEGLLLSDLYMVNSNFVKNQVLEAFGETFQIYAKSIEDKIFVFPPLLDEYQIVGIGAIHPKMMKRDTVRIIYNHRLSSLPYYNDAYQLFLSGLKEFDRMMKEYNWGVKIIVTFTDASGKLKTRRDIKFKNTDRIKIVLKGGMDKIDYLKELVKSDVCVATFKEDNGGGWSISLAEAILADCRIVAPRHSGYAEMLPEKFDGLIDQLTPNGIGVAIYNAIKAPYSDLVKKHYMNNFNAAKLITQLYARLFK